MTDCRQCQYEFDVSRPAPETCPRCGAAVAANGPPTEWVAVARMSNPAESGYFADLLLELEIPAEVVQHDEFSAIDGSWGTVFLLRVPHALANRAAAVLRQDVEQHVVSSEREDAAAEPVNQFPPHLTPQASDARPSLWGSFLVLLAVAAVAYWAGRSGLGPRPGAKANEPSLWHALGESSAPLVNRPRRGEPVRTLRFDSRTRHIVLEEDNDGDGNYESRREFSEPR